MKICLSSRVLAKYLQKADIIRMAYRDRNYITDLFITYPNKSFIIEFPNPLTDIDLEFIDIKVRPYAFCTTLMLGNPSDKSLIDGLDWFFGFPLTSWIEVNAAIAEKAAYVCPAGPVFFSIDKLKEKNIKPYFVLNLAHRTQFGKPNPLHGTFILPQHLNYYSHLDGVFAFENVSPEAEEALYRIYFEDKDFPGDLDLIIKDIGVSTPNRMILPSIGEYRLNCGQNCEAGRNCSICDNAVKAASKIKVKYAANLSS